MITHESGPMTDADFISYMERRITNGDALPVATIERMRRLADWADTFMPAKGYMLVDKQAGLKAIAAARARLPKDPEPQADETLPDAFVKAVDAAAKGIGQAVDRSLDRFLKAAEAFAAPIAPREQAELTNAEVEWVWRQAVEAWAHYGRLTPWPDMADQLEKWRATNRG